MRTTRCCSAVALTLLIRIADIGANAAPGAPKELPFFPTRAVWSLPLNNLLTQPPAFDSRRGYFPIAGQRLVAYDLKTGTLAWTVTAAPAMPPTTGDDLIFSVQDSALVALRASDGSPAWRAALEQPLAVPPVWDNGWLVLAGANGGIVAMSAKDGRVIWRRNLAAVPRARPALAADRVYVPVANRVVALNVETGEPSWDRRLGGDPHDVLALDDRVYVGSTDNYLYCIDAESGAVDWRSMRTGADVIGLPAHDDDSVYFVSLDNVLRAVSRRSGVQRWMKQLPLRPNTGPVRAGATIIAAGQSTSLPTFNARDGVAVGALPATPELAVPPHLLADGGGGLPAIVLVTKDIVKGAVVSMITRGIDPSPSPILALPGSITTLPTVSSPAESAARERD